MINDNPSIKSGLVGLYSFLSSFLLLSKNYTDQYYKIFPIKYCWF